MTTPPEPNPYAPVATPVAAPVDRWRWLLTGVIGILGGYLTMASIAGGLVNALNPFSESFPVEVTVQLIVLGLFAVAVPVFAYLVSPGGGIGRKLLASAIWIVGAFGTFGLLWGRLFGEVRGQGVNIIANPFFLILLFGALAWLIAVNARGLSYLALLLTLAVMPLAWLFAMAGASNGIAVLVQYTLCLVIAVVVLLVSRPRTAAPPVPEAQPAG